MNPPGTTLLFSLLTFVVLLANANGNEGQKNFPAPPKPLRADGIENFFQASERVFSGSSPATDDAFRALKKLGIQSIISVDGAAPEVALAKKYGLRYAHLPLGYDTVNTEETARLIKAAQTLPGPIFVHCHQGKHRGPAAVATICLGTENWDRAQGLAWLQTAGTSHDYAGLFQSIEDFKKPDSLTLAKLPDIFPEQMKPTPLVKVMVQMDKRFDNLKRAQKRGFAKQTKEPEINPAQEALLLEELYRELLRATPTEQHGSAFAGKMKAGHQAAAKLHAILKDENVLPERANAAFQRITESCSTCHKAHRN